MSNESYLCNSLYLNKGYQSINTANDCAIIKSDQINSDKHLLHLTDPENKKDFYVCRGIYNYKEGTCTVNPELTKLISENSPIQQSATVQQPVATPVATPIATPIATPAIIQAKMISKGLGGCGGAPYLKADNLPEKGTIEECSNACINNTDCIKYQRSPDGTCYFMDKNSLVRTPEPSGNDNGWQCMFKSPPATEDPVAPPPPPPPQMVSIKGNAELMKVYGSENADGTGKGGFEPSVYYDSKNLTWRQQNECKQACLDDPECEIAHHFFSNATCYLGKKEAVADQSKWKCHWDQNGCNGKNYGFYIKQ